MKKRIFLFTVVLLIISTLFIISASAHPGRTDANGGHWNHSTGEYHYHTGENTDSGSSGNSSYKSYSSFKPPYDPPPRKSSTDSSDSIVPLVLICIVLILLIYFIVIRKSFFTISPKLTEYEKHITNHINSLDYLSQQKSRLNELEKFSTIPDKYIIGHDGLIREKDSLMWGDTFTLYTSLYDDRLHCKRGCCDARYTEHIYNHLDSDNFCPDCFTQEKQSTIVWLKKYRDYNLIKRDYEHLIAHSYYPSEVLLDSHKKCNSLLIKFILLFRKTQRQRLSDLNNKYQTYTSNK